MKQLLRSCLLLAATPSFAQTSELQPTAPVPTQVIQILTPATTSSINDLKISGTQVVKNIPSVGAPALTSNGDACMGATSGSMNGPGFGISLGSTWTDNNCKMLKNSRELWNMGMKAAALALMCTDPQNKEALEATGYECPKVTPQVK